MPNNEVLGAAIATAISNTVSLLYFMFYKLCHRENPVYHFTTGGGKKIPLTTVDILKSGIPSLFLLAAGQESNFFLNGMIADMGASSAVAGKSLLTLPSFIPSSSFQIWIYPAKDYLSCKIFSVSSSSFNQSATSFPASTAFSP